MQIIWGLILVGSSTCSELAVGRNLFTTALARRVMQVVVGKGVMLEPEPEGCLVGSVR